jgi:hypothetical protein
MKCPKCDKEMDLYEKDTSSGRDMRTYVCLQCDKWVDVDNGVALWQVLHDAREQEVEVAKGTGNAVEKKSGNKWWHYVVALLLGYVAAGITYELAQIVLAYPAGMFSAATGSAVFSLDVLRAVAGLVAIGVWVLVYRRFVRNWGRGGP